MRRCASVLVFFLVLPALYARSPDDRGSPEKPAPKNENRPLKVFILAGQSNMQGHASISTFDSLLDDPKTAPILKEMRDPDGKPRVCEKVWISSVGCAGDGWKDVIEQKGKLTAGFGASPEEIGPEFTFGISMEKLLGEPVLIIKTSWGGRSLHTDFRPPSAGPETFNDFTVGQWKKRGLDVNQESAKINKNVGVFYRHMIEHVRKVLADIKRVAPDYDPKQGYELAGFVWFQGFNDMIDDWTYHDRMKPGGYDQYGELLSQFIRDVRKDLSAPKMPFVIGVMGIGGVEEGKKAPQMYFRQAQAAPASLPEFKGNVAAVQTAPFWDDELAALRERMEKVESKTNEAAKKNPNLTPAEKDAALKKAVAATFTPEELKRLKGVSNGGYHYLGAAKIMAPIGEVMGHAMMKLCSTPVRGEGRAKAGEMAGYLLAPHGRVDKEYNAGFSIYVAAWPLLREYPGDRFQTGLFGTWMHAQYDTPPRGKYYSDIEGGLGWWRETQFATSTPKFVMGGVALNFCEWANGPGAGKGRDWDKPAGQYGIAQLSPWVLWPPDGLNLAQGTSGELFGYGYLPLPLTSAKKTTAGKNVPTGDQCWTLFLNTGNFKGPVAFFTPYFWSKPTLENPQFAGQFLDARPSDPNKALQMETQYVPCFISTDSKGQTFARIAPTSFPRDAKGNSVVVHRITAYKKEALWSGVKSWFEGGDAVSGAIDMKGATVHKFRDEGGSTWRMYGPDAPKERRTPIDWNAFATPVAIDEYTYGYRWDAGKVTSNGSLTTLPEYFRLGKSKNDKDQWQAIPAADVPAETGLAEVTFGRPRDARPPEPYVTPEGAKSCWKSPGPAAGPFTAKLGDGSVVTYFWYRFADQPALLNADLTDAEREELQKKVELLHRHWTKDKEYLPPNTVGTLANIDSSLLVTPPKGMEVGYVPIVTRQAAK
jgi:hypothetical protein